MAVAETRNFTRAAERCRVVQSALSHQIAALERELGARLFERTSRRVRLTPAGEAFLTAARECLEAADRARAEVASAAGEIRGRLAVGTIPTVAAVDLPVALREYRRRYPRVRITLTAAGSDELVERVRQGAVDVAFLGLPPRAEPRASGAAVSVAASWSRWSRPTITGWRPRRTCGGWRTSRSSTSVSARRAGRSRTRRSRPRGAA